MAGKLNKDQLVELKDMLVGGTMAMVESQVHHSDDDDAAPPSYPDDCANLKADIFGAGT